MGSRVSDPWLIFSPISPIFEVWRREMRWGKEIMSLEGRQRGRYFAAKLRSSSVWTMVARSRFSWSGIFFGSRLFGLWPLWIFARSVFKKCLNLDNSFIFEFFFSLSSINIYISWNFIYIYLLYILLYLFIYIYLEIIYNLEIFRIRIFLIRA